MASEAAQNLINHLERRSLRNEEVGQPVRFFVHGFLSARTAFIQQRSMIDYEDEFEDEDDQETSSRGTGQIRGKVKEDAALGAWSPLAGGKLINSETSP
jgi:hypothetical protein